MKLTKECIKIDSSKREENPSIVGDKVQITLTGNIFTLP